MKKIIIVSILLIAQSTKAQNKDSLRMHAAIHFDTIFLKSQLHDSLIYIHSNGLIESKIGFIQSVISQSIVYSKARFIAYKSTFSQNLNINLGEVEVEGFLKEQQFKVRLRFTSVYKKSKKGKWLLHYWQSTKVG